MVWIVGIGAVRIEFAKMIRLSAVSAIWVVRRMMVVVRDAIILGYVYDFGVRVVVSIGISRSRETRLQCCCRGRVTLWASLPVMQSHHGRLVLICRSEQFSDAEGVRFVFSDCVCKV